MSKFERVFYVVVILAMFALVILFQLRLKETRQQAEMNVQDPSQQGQRLFSFQGESPTGEKAFVHFTAYSPNYYIILNTSANCPHCLSMLQDLQTFKPQNKLPENVSIYLITTDEFPELLPPPDSPVKALKISFDDWYQFGMEPPSGRVAPKSIFFYDSNTIGVYDYGKSLVRLLSRDLEFIKEVPVKAAFSDLAATQKSLTAFLFQADHVFAFLDADFKISKNLLMEPARRFITWMPVGMSSVTISAG